MSFGAAEKDTATGPPHGNSESHKNASRGSPTYSDAMAEDEANPGYTLSATCDFLNRELAACGFPSPLKLYKGEESNNEETRRIIDCLFAMLQQHQVRRN